MKKGFLLLVGFITCITLIFWLIQLRKPEPTCMPTQLIIGTSADFPPFAFKNEQRELTGFDIDVITEICKRLELPYTFKDMPFEMLLPQLQLGTIHLIAAGMSATPERSQRILFSTPYLTTDPLAIIGIADGKKIESIDDLKGKNIIVNQGYTADLYMSKIRGINLIRLPTVADAFAALHAGKGDAYVSALSALQPFFRTYGQDSFTLTLIDDANEELAFGISKAYPELGEKINELLQDLQADGTLQKLKNTWHLQ